MLRLTFPARHRTATCGSGEWSCRAAFIDAGWVWAGVPALGATGERHLMANFTFMIGEGKRKKEKTKINKKNPPSRESRGLAIGPWAGDKAAQGHRPWLPGFVFLLGFLALGFAEHSRELPRRLSPARLHHNSRSF